MIRIKSNGTDFNSLRGYVFLFEFTSDVAFNESCFTDSSVSD